MHRLFQKCLISYFQVRSEAVDRETKLLLESLTDSVNRRDALVDKAAILANTKQAKSLQTQQMDKTLANKKIEDLKRKLRKMRREEAELKKELMVRRSWDHLQSKTSRRND